MTVRVRPAKPADLPRLTEIYNHYVRRTAVTFDVQPFTVAERMRWFDHYRPEGRHRLFVACANGAAGGEGEEGAVVGYATSSPFRAKAAYDSSVETSIYCDPGAVGRGVGTALYEALFAALAGEDVHRAFGGIALPNDASVALHRRFGFTEVGVFAEVGHKFGRYWDVLWMGRTV